MHNFEVIWFETLKECRRIKGKKKRTAVWEI